MYSGMFFIEPLVIIPLSFCHIWRKYKVTKCDLFMCATLQRVALFLQRFYATFCVPFAYFLQPFCVTFCLWLHLLYLVVATFECLKYQRLKSQKTLTFTNILAILKLTKF